MRMKRAVAALLSVMLTLTLCLFALPREAMAVSYVQIAGLALTTGTPYYKDGATHAQDPGGWTAHFTSNALQLRNLGQTGISDQGIFVPVDTYPYPMQLEGASSFKLSNLSSGSAITGTALVFTGNGSLSVASGNGVDSTYGITANDIILQYPASLTVAGRTHATSARIDTADWSKYTVKADTDMSGTNAAVIKEDEYLANLQSYKYVSFTAIPQPGPGPGPGGGGTGAVDSDVLADAVVPRTGDGARPWLYLFLALAAGAGLAVSASRKRRTSK